MKYDPFSAETHRDPYPVYKWLRDECPVYHNEEHDFWAVSRYEDVRSVLCDWERFSNREGVDIDKTDALLAPGNMDELDGPPHDAMRKLVQFWFSPKSLRTRLERKLRNEAKIILAEMSNSKICDLTQGLAWQLPTLVVADMFNLPYEERPLILSYMKPVFRRVAGEPTPPDEAITAGENIGAYLQDKIECRRRESLHGSDDLIAVLLASRLNGEPLSDKQILGTVAHLFVASSGTTQDAISNSLYLLAMYPDQREKLINNPDAIPDAIEECLRFETPVQTVTRVTTKDIVMHETAIPAGSTVVAILASANRDERFWDDPETFDISRTPRRHLAFADGIHHCLGAPIARLETRIAIGEVLTAMPEYELIEAIRACSHVGRGFDELRIQPNAGN